MKTGMTLGALLLAFSLLGAAPSTGVAQEQADAANPDAKCVKCHSRGLKKKLENGETMSLKVDVATFETSVHRVIGCTGCHRDVAKGKHPSREPIASARAYSLKHNQTCSQCHAAKYEAYEGSVHARLVASGSEEAPLCSDCHSAHAIQPRATREPADGEPCKNCHTGIFQAWEESVHGTARREGNVIRGAHVQAPTCADCHEAHRVAPVATVDYLASTCMSCHEVAKLAHEKWLPNSPMHLKSVGCAACHAPESELRVDLQLYDLLADTPVDSSDQYAAFHEQLEAIDPDGDGLSGMDLWKLIRLTERDGMDTNVELRGRLEVATGMGAHRLADSSQATRSCESCHDSDSKAFGNVTVSITRPDGRKQRFEADNAVLSSIFSVDSVSGFYAPGGTRIKLLDYLLVLAVLGGLAVPVVHISLGKIIRKQSRKPGRK
jgi:hypothetical protein